jgi:hypothetical protein
MLSLRNVFILAGALCTLQLGCGGTNTDTADDSTSTTDELRRERNRGRDHGHECDGGSPDAAPSPTPEPTPSPAPYPTPEPTPAPAPTLDGAALYGSRCAGCHGSLASSAVAGATAASIQGKHGSTHGTAEEYAAIAAALQ